MFRTFHVLVIGKKICLAHCWFKGDCLSDQQSSSFQYCKLKNERERERERDRENGKMRKEREIVYNFRDGYICYIFDAWH